MLTGKAKEDFEKWYVSQLRNRNDIGDRYFDYSLLNYFWNSAGDTMVHAFILEWLDSVGIYIDIEFFRESLKGITFISGTTTKENGFEPTKEEFPDRQSAIKKAIEQANKIYN